MVESDVTFPAEDSRCEGCGYALRGLDISGNCPECGLAIAESSPAKRTGLPWQHKRTLKNWLLTNWMVLTRPSWAFRVMKLETEKEEGLLLIQVLAASLFSAGWLVCILLFYPTTFEQITSDFVAATICVVVLLTIMTELEVAGVWGFSKAKKKPVSWHSATQVCGYAAVGWFWLPLFWTVVGVVVPLQMDFWLRVADSMLGLWLVLLLLTCGSVIWFETLVWIGIRQVRFGNTAKAPEPAGGGRG